MPDFNTIFPRFTESCVQLKQLLTPIAYLLLVGGLISTTITSHRSAQTFMRSLGRTIVLIMVLTFLVSWGNTITTVVDSTVKNVMKVDPTKIYDDYQAALEMRRSTEDNRSWWEKIFEWRATLFESLISAFLWLLGWIASAIVFYAYIIQKVILFIGYALAPIFIGFLAFGNLYGIGRRYFLQLVGVMVWPLGWGVAGIVTQGLIDFMTDRSFLHTPVVGYDAYTLQNFIGVALLAIWIIFSTIAAPVIMQRAISEGFSVGSFLVSGAASAGRAALVTGVTTGASVASGGTGAALAGGVVAGAAAATESLASISAGLGSGSMINSLAYMRPPGRSAGSRKASDSKRVASSPFPGDDLTGDKTVGELLRKTRNPPSQK
jgi:hypothetical protein